MAEPIDSTPVSPGDAIRARDRNDTLSDIERLARRVEQLERAVETARVDPRCRNCLAPLFFVGLYEVTVDNEDDTYVAKQKHVSNTGTTTTDKMTTADMSGDFARLSTVTPLNDVQLVVGDDILVLGSFDAGTSTGEPIVRYFAVRAKDYTFADDGTWTGVATADDGFTVTYSHTGPGPTDATLGGVTGECITSIYLDAQRHVVGASGESCPVGATGPQGDQGGQGDTGPSGCSGPQGATGPTGCSGPQGATGPTGCSGPQGATGPSANLPDHPVGDGDYILRVASGSPSWVAHP